MEKKRTHIFRKEKGQIVVQGEVNLTDSDGNKIPHVINLLCVAAQNQKNFHSAMVHTN